MPQRDRQPVPRTEATRSWRGPLIVFVAGLAVYGAFHADRLLEASRDNHYVYLAEAMLDGRLHLDGAPPHRNDWARRDGRWYVSFPPLPAVLMIPGVALSGLELNDRLYTLPFAAAGPALLFALLQLLVARGRLRRSRTEIAALTALYGLGTVYFFSAVQGSVWYTAHMVGGVMLLGFLLAAVDARRPVLAGLFLGLAFACRPPMLLAFPFFLYELVRQGAGDDESASWRRALRGLGLARFARSLLLFGAPVAAVLGALMWMNWARFADPFEFGHRYLEVIQAPRIEKWGLFSYHYLARNLGATLTSLPWLTSKPPHVVISLHGLALWVTTPAFLWLLGPGRWDRPRIAWLVAALLVAAPTLLYQNTGWVQFGQRFSLDYTPLLILLLAASSRRFSRLFVAAIVIAIAVNAFGAVTFGRVRAFYSYGPDRHALYQPD